jgi:K+-sensing histidine kinase KdpD
MEAETLAKVFRAFYTTKQGGSGLGLPTARKIVEAHGGSIDIESTPGRGTKVTIWLPAPPRLPTTDTRSARVAGRAVGADRQLDGPEGGFVPSNAS